MNRTVDSILMVIGGAVFVLIAGYMTTLLWGWITPDVFAGAVAAGVIPAALTFTQGVKISLFMSTFCISLAISSGLFPRKK